MAGDYWIKMRGSLRSHPKLIRFARELHSSPDFRRWLMPGAQHLRNGARNASATSAQQISDEALRSVALGLLFCCWSVARDYGEFVGDDLFLSGLALEDLDMLGGAPGIGAAMKAVGWAEKVRGKNGVSLPNFKEYNVPKTAAERMRDSRKARCADVAQTVARGTKKERKKGSTKERKKETSAFGLGDVRNKNRPSAEKRAGVFSKLTADTLRDTAAMVAWHHAAAGKPKPVIGGSESDRLFVLAAAECAIERGENAPALFAWLVAGKKRDGIRQEHEDRARARLRALEKPNGLPPEIQAAIKPKELPA